MPETELQEGPESERGASSGDRGRHHSAES